MADWPLPGWPYDHHVAWKPWSWYNDFNTGRWIAHNGGNIRVSFGLPRTFRFRYSSSVRHGHTDRQTDKRTDGRTDVLLSAMRLRTERASNEMTVIYTVSRSEANSQIRLNKTQPNRNTHYFNCTNCYLFNVNCISFSRIYNIVSAT